MKRKATLFAKWVRIHRLTLGRRVMPGSADDDNVRGRSHNIRTHCPLNPRHRVSGPCRGGV